MLTKDLTLHLPLNYIHNGDRLIDRSSHKRHATARGGPTVIQDSSHGTCLSFDGINDYVQLDPTSIPQGNALSVSFWARGGEQLPKNHALIQAKDHNQQRTLSIYLPWRDGRIFFDCGNDGDEHDRTTKPALPEDYKGQWSHWGFTKNAISGEMNIYLNGELWHSSLGHHSPIPPSAEATLGTSTTKRGDYHGGLAQLRLFDRALTADEFKQLMQQDIGGTQLHLAMNRANADSISDSSGNDFHGQIRGNPRWVADTSFGTCLDFNGIDDYLAIQNLSYSASDLIPAITVSGWINTNNSMQGVIISWDRSEWWRLAIGNDVGKPQQRVFWATRASSGINDMVGQQVVADGQWHHIAVTYQSVSGAKKIYVDGRLDAEQISHSGLPLGGGETRYGLVGVGSEAATFDGNKWPLDYFQGRLANLRVYNRVLTVEDIHQLIATEPTGSHFTNTLPIDFDLLDDEQSPTLGIVDGESGQPMYLTVTNKSDKGIELIAPSNNAASPSNHHLELRFRPGTLTKSSLKQIGLNGQSTDQWSHWPRDQQNDGQQAMANPDGSYSLYLLHKAGTNISATDTLLLALGPFTAEIGGGARSTRVELKYQQMQYTGNPKKLSGNRTKHLNIVNHRGKKHIPLHVGFVGSNTLSNEGSANTVTLRITNTAKTGSNSIDKSAITLKGIDDSDAPSKFIFSFDTQQTDEDWALGTPSQVKAVQFSWGAIGELTTFVYNETVLPLANPLKDDIPDGSKLIITTFNGLQIPITLSGSAAQGDRTLHVIEEVTTAIAARIHYDTSFLGTVIDRVNGRHKVIVHGHLFRSIPPGSKIKTASSTQASQLLTVTRVTKTPITSDLKITFDEAVELPIGTRLYVDEHPEWSMEYVEGESPQWVLSPRTSVSFNSKEHLQYTLSDIISTAPLGHTNLYINYENIPGYWDGQLVAVLEKSLLVQRDVFGRNTHSYGDLLLDGNAYVQDGSINFNGNSPLSVKLSHQGSKNNNFGISIDAQDKNGLVNTYDVLSIDRQGKVGIGTQTPLNKLYIDGGLGISNEGDNAYINFYADQNRSCQIGMQDDSNQGFYVKHNGTYLFSVNTSGNVAIGGSNHVTKLANAPLHIRRPSDTNNNLEELLRLERSCDRVTTNSYGYAEGGFIGLHVSDAHNINTEKARIVWRADNKGSSDSDGRLSFYTQDNNYSRESMTIFGNGNAGVSHDFGVGTLKPKARLHLTRPSNDNKPFIRLDADSGKNSSNKGSVLHIDFLYEDAIEADGESPYGGRRNLFIEYGYATKHDPVPQPHGADPEVGLYLDKHYNWKKPSDITLKENVTPLEGMLDKLNQLQPVNFTWKNDQSDDIGFIAQEAEKVFPNLVGKMPSRTGKSKLKSMSYSGIDVITVAAVQEMAVKYDEKIDDLQQQIDVLKAFITDKR